jgi:hypothetical protein
MFSLDKDLKKGVNKSVQVKNKIPSSYLNKTLTDKISSTNDIVEIAKIEREKRKLDRDLNNHVNIIQKCWRGRWKSYLFLKSTTQQFDEKISDIKKVSLFLLEKNGILFIPPLQICIEMTRLLFFGNNNNKVKMFTWILIFILKLYISCILSYIFIYK